MLSSEQRKRSLPVDDVLDHLQPIQGLTVVDVGCGSGYFAVPFAQSVGTGGLVYAVDTSPEMLTLLKEAALGIDNLIPVLSEENAIPLDNGVADLVFSSTVYHEFDDRPAMLQELCCLGRTDTRYVVIDWNQRSAEHGPPLKHRVPEEEVISEHIGHDLELVKQFEPGPDHCGLIFRAAEKLRGS